MFPLEALDELDDSLPPAGQAAAVRLVDSVDQVGQPAGIGRAAHRLGQGAAGGVHFRVGGVLELLGPLHLVEQALGGLVVVIHDGRAQRGELAPPQVQQGGLLVQQFLQRLDGVGVGNRRDHREASTDSAWPPRGEGAPVWLHWL